MYIKCYSKENCCPYIWKYGYGNVDAFKTTRLISVSSREIQSVKIKFNITVSTFSNYKDVVLQSQEEKF